MTRDSRREKSLALMDRLGLGALLMRRSIEAGQAFPWNPSLPGAKAEETFILTVNGGETITSV